MQLQSDTAAQHASWHEVGLKILLRLRKYTYTYGPPFFGVDAIYEKPIYVSQVSNQESSRISFPDDCGASCCFCHPSQNALCW